MTSLSANTDTLAGTDLLGKSVGDLQSGITINSDSITGTLKYVTGYTGFSGDPNEQKGNFLALHVTTDSVEVDRITIQVIGGDHPAVTLDPSDNIAIFRIKNNAQQIQIVAYKDGRAAAKIYDLRGLTLTPAS